MKDIELYKKLRQKQKRNEKHSIGFAKKRVFIGCTNFCINYAVSGELAGAHGLQFVKVLLNLTLENSFFCMRRSFKS